LAEPLTFDEDKEEEDMLLVVEVIVRVEAGGRSGKVYIPGLNNTSDGGEEQ